MVPGRSNSARWVLEQAGGAAGRYYIHLQVGGSSREVERHGMAAVGSGGQGWKRGQRFAAPPSTPPSACA
jgi:hypothetical protein